MSPLPLSKGKMKDRVAGAEKRIEVTPSCHVGQNLCQKQGRKGVSPMRLLPLIEHTSDFGRSGSWICKNSACRAGLSTEDVFYRRCSCCISHLFDDNKDPSLWLVCSSESGDAEDSCGSSCHIERALRKQKVGMVDLGQLMQLDGSYCCASCGKVSCMLGNWKRQLVVAKDVRPVDALHYRICLSYRLLDGTSRFKELHNIVKEAKVILESEIGTINGVSASITQGIVSRLSKAGEVQKLCDVALERAEEILKTISDGRDTVRGYLRPAACKILFEEVNASSISIILLELSSDSSAAVKGYKFWYGKSGERVQSLEPACVFPPDHRRIVISNLQPCTEYNFYVVSYTEVGDFGHSEANCFTRSLEVVGKRQKVVHGKDQALMKGNSLACVDIEPKSGVSASVSPGFKVRDLGMVLHLDSAHNRGHLEGFCFVDINKCRAVRPEHDEIVRIHDSRLVPPELDLNIATMPDLNEEVLPPYEYSGDYDNCCSLERAFEVLDSDSTLINVSPCNLSSNSCCLDKNFEYCVKMIRLLEFEGHISQEFSLRSTEQERRMVHTFAQTLIDEPIRLSEQLLDTFSLQLWGRGRFL